MKKQNSKKFRLTVVVSGLIFMLPLGGLMSLVGDGSFGPIVVAIFVAGWIVFAKLPDWEDRFEIYEEAITENRRLYDKSDGRTIL